MNRKADDVVQHQNKRRFQRKPDKQHHLYSVWRYTTLQNINYYNLSSYLITLSYVCKAYVSRVGLCKCEGEHCRWHSATCTLQNLSAEATFLM
ncbi:hypothetical protein T12_2021 [Trichinella patagoniensis]|uniref:Uncharacterized protein n=1 Tax=Trichinella patagoniensis TaxID=990121 RepID=A0A0V1AD27_9BILA|nr:hypothetical protein T12_2021 [Trichinella patagoniensis]